MARNRKRAKERRARRPAAAQAARPGVATARPDIDARADLNDRTEVETPPQTEALDEAGTPPEIEELPGSLRHAAPDVELAEVQVALGAERAQEIDEDEGDGDLADDGGDYDGGSGSAPPDGDDGSGGGELTPAGQAGVPAEPRRLPGNRLINFLQGSWRELQRVQWPDRRQVMQATGVVIGFVIVAGVFLGVADQIAGKVVTLILK